MCVFEKWWFSGGRNFDSRGRSVEKVDFAKIGMKYDKFQKFIKDILICFSFFKANEIDDEEETKAIEHGSSGNPIPRMSKHEKLTKENLKAY